VFMINILGISPMLGCPTYTGWELPDLHLDQSDRKTRTDLGCSCKRRFTYIDGMV
jgi:hypothetical protein